MKVFILATAFSGLCQRIQRELILLGHEIQEHYDLEPDSLRLQLNAFGPDVVLCPFLTQRIPDDVWKTYLCLVVHPGIEGDRGPSSLDWAISQNCSEWGVTLLQANAEMDMGDIWQTKNFSMRNASKISIYKREVSTSAINHIKKALIAIESDRKISRPLNYENVNVVGQLQPYMRQSYRKINWDNETTDDILQKIHAADTNPGVLDSINGYEVYLYGARAEHTLTGKAGEIIAIHQGSCCRATRDGAIWIRQLKCRTHNKLPAVKLPASMILNELLTERQKNALLDASVFIPHDDIRVETKGGTAFVTFDFYNGAANTQQCIELKNRLIALKQSDVKCIVFMGGEDFWSNGIHLNCIEANQNVAQESWLNINAINDVVYEMINCPKQMTIAALRNNAGAGGAIMALACDKVLIRDGVVLNPHYASMGLFGSEYWTYLLPKRIGISDAKRIMRQCKPMLASEAMDKRIADELLPEDWQSYHDALHKRCEQIVTRTSWPEFFAQKLKQRERDEKRKPLNAYRREELAEMKKTFDNPYAEYHQLRHNFVHKIKAEKQVERETKSMAAVAWEALGGSLRSA